MSRSIHYLFIIPIIILSFSISTAQGKEYPISPITIINPYPVGGGVDAAARALAKEIQQHLGQPVIVESKPAAMGLIAGEYVAKAKPDGYTIGIFTSASFHPEVYKPFRKASYTSNDIEPVIRYMILASGLASRAGMPWNNLNELVKYVQDNPNKVRVGHSGFGNPNHILYYSLAKANKLEMIEVSFKGAGDFKVALLGGHVDVGMTSMSSVKPFIEQGRVKMLAIQYPKRMAAYPEVPTYDEIGCLPKGYPYPIYGLFVPKGTSEAVKKIIHDVTKQAMETTFLQTFAKENDIDLYYGEPGHLREDTKKEKEVFGTIIEEMAKKYR